MKAADSARPRGRGSRLAVSVDTGPQLGGPGMAAEPEACPCSRPRAPGWGVRGFGLGQTAAHARQARGISSPFRASLLHL